MRRASRDYYARDTIDVARDLLGATLELRADDGRVLRARIVETEAYLGPEDPACHSFAHRRTARIESMYGAPGLAYVYLIYGMYHCLNVVTAAPGVAEAVLIRAAEPSRGFVDPDPRIAAGPGKLCRAFGITRAHDGLDLVLGDRLTIYPALGPVDVVAGPRVGLGDRHDAVHWPLRFGIRGSPALSKPRFESSDLDLPSPNLRLKIPKEVRDEDL